MFQMTNTENLWATNQYDKYTSDRNHVPPAGLEEKARTLAPHAKAVGGSASTRSGDLLRGDGNARAAPAGHYSHREQGNLAWGSIEHRILISISEETEKKKTTQRNHNSLHRTVNVSLFGRNARIVDQIYISSRYCCRIPALNADRNHLV